MCNFIFVGNNRTDFSNLYNPEYYNGKGADPLVDYCFEIDNSNKAIRNYEWAGICEVFNSVIPVSNVKDSLWLDYGCGSGGLVNYALSKGFNIFGYEEGLAANISKERGLPILDKKELDLYIGKFDFVSLIEVIEHIERPIEFLKFINKLLKPGGVLFLTTGNVGPWKDRVLEWPYSSIPDVHISFFEPKTLSYALECSGFFAKHLPTFSGFSNIIKFKILKNLGFKRLHMLYGLLPWWLITRIINLKYKITDMPIGKVR